jgi:hypothetical protein
MQNFTYSILYDFARWHVAADVVRDFGAGRERLEIDHLQGAGSWAALDQFRMTVIFPDHLSPARGFIDAQGV